jgi:hypothetical protein
MATAPVSDVSFPPGPMGLELEPVIVSSSRQMGCRVKDFYNEDAEGQRTSAVQIGDIVWQINGVKVQSERFVDILSTLKSTAESTRIITFKNIKGFPSTGNQYIFPLLSCCALSESALLHGPVAIHLLSHSAVVLHRRPLPLFVLVLDTITGSSSRPIGPGGKETSNWNC